MVVLRIYLFFEDHGFSFPCPMFRSLAARKSAPGCFRESQGIWFWTQCSFSASPGTHHSTFYSFTAYYHQKIFPSFNTWHRKQKKKKRIALSFFCLTVRFGWYEMQYTFLFKHVELSSTLMTWNWKLNWSTWKSSDTEIKFYNC